MSERDYTVPAVARTLEILEFIGSHESPTLQDIIDDLNLPKTSVYQILRTLHQRGYLRQTRIPGGYALGLRLFSLGNQAIGQLDIRNEATPVLYKLMRETQHTCFLGVIEDSEAMYLAKVDGPQSMAMRSWVGKRFDLQTTSMGKVLLAWNDIQAIKGLLSKRPPQLYTDKAILDIDAYLAHLTEVRAKGWAFDDEENRPGIRCVAAPVFGVMANVVAAISVSGPVEQLLDDSIPALADAVRKAAGQLSQQLGYRIPSGR